MTPLPAPGCAILYPITSREIQGDYHEFREKGRAEVVISSEEKFILEKNYFDTLEDLERPYDCVNAQNNLVFIHAKDDEIASIKYVQDFLSTLRGREHRGVLELIELEGLKHMHHISSYSQDYVTITINVISRSLLSRLLTGGDIYGKE